MAAAVASPPRQPDIAYTPDFEKYRARTKRRFATEDLKDQALPAGFPEKLEGDFVWEGENVAKAYDWIYVLNEAEISEIEEALKHFKCMFLYLSMQLETDLFLSSSKRTTRSDQPEDISTSAAAFNSERNLQRASFRPWVQSNSRLAC